MRKLEDLHPADIAEIMEDLSAAERQGIIASLDEETAAAVPRGVGRASHHANRGKNWIQRKRRTFWKRWLPDAGGPTFWEICPRKLPKNFCTKMPGQEADEVPRVAGVRSPQRPAA